MAPRSGDDLAEAARAIVENRAEDFARTLAHLTSLVARGTRLGTRCSTWRLRWTGSDASRRSCAPARTSARARDAGVSVVERAIEHEKFELADYLVKWCERHGVELG